MRRIAKRWQDALALRKQGIGVIGAFNIQHLETVAPTAEALIGYPVREIIPLSFLQAADEVVALDVSPRLLQSRVKAGKIVNAQDVDRALNGVFKEQTLYMLRELLLRTVDNLTLPVVEARTHLDGRGLRLSRTSIPHPSSSAPRPSLRRSTWRWKSCRRKAWIARALDRIAASSAARCCTRPFDPASVPGDRLRASLVAVPTGKIGAKLANIPLPYDLFIVGRNANIPRRKSGAFAVFANGRRPAARGLR